MRKVLFAAIAPAAILGWAAAGANPPAPQPKPADPCHHESKSTDDHMCDHHDGKPAGDHH